MRYWIFALINCAITINCLFAGNSLNKEVLLNSDSVARFEYLKLEYTIFLAKTDEEKYDALIKKIKLCIAHNAVDKSLFEIKRLALLDESLLQRNDFYSVVEGILFNGGSYNACLEYLYKDTLQGFKLDKSFIKVLCLNQENEYDLIKQEIRKAAAYSNKDTSHLFSELKRYHEKESEKKSMIMQGILPGLGMINEGEFKEGVTSFLLNGIFVTIPILLVSKQFYFSAFSYGLMPLTKFYGGGLRHTKYLSQINYDKKMEAIRQKNAALLFQFYLDE
jgi:hypothetical protein